MIILVGGIPAGRLHWGREAKQPGALYTGSDAMLQGEVISRYHQRGGGRDDERTDPRAQ